jgi:hypothetical protein
MKTLKADTKYFEDLLIKDTTKKTGLSISQLKTCVGPTYGNTTVAECPVAQAENKPFIVLAYNPQMTQRKNDFASIKLPNRNYKVQVFKDGAFHDTDSDIMEKMHLADSGKMSDYEMLVPLDFEPVSATIIQVIPIEEKERQQLDE